MRDRLSIDALITVSARTLAAHPHANSTLIQSAAATDINAAGDIVGIWSDATNSRGFLLQNGAFTPIAFPLATRTMIFGINDAGEIAGFYDDATGNTHGFIFASGAFSIVDVSARAARYSRASRTTGW